VLLLVREAQEEQQDKTHPLGLTPLLVVALGICKTVPPVTEVLVVAVDTTPLVTLAQQTKVMMVVMGPRVSQITQEVEAGERRQPDQMEAVDQAVMVVLGILPATLYMIGI